MIPVPGSDLGGAGRPPDGRHQLSAKLLEGEKRSLQDCGVQGYCSSMRSSLGWFLGSFFFFLQGEKALLQGGQARRQETSLRSVSQLAF